MMKYDNSLQSTINNVKKVKKKKKVNLRVTVMRGSCPKMMNVSTSEVFGVDLQVHAKSKNP